MKKLLFAILLLVGVSAHAQTVTGNSVTFTSTVTTTTQIVLDRGTLSLYLPRLVTVIMHFPAGNAGTVQVNGAGTSIPGTATVYSATTHLNGIIFSCVDGFAIKFTNVGDKVSFTY